MNTAYHLGKLFAVACYIKGVEFDENIYTLLMKPHSGLGKVMNHLHVMHGDATKSLDDMLTDIFRGISHYLPDEIHINSNDGNMFWVGFYHQRKALRAT